MRPARLYRPAIAPKGATPEGSYRGIISDATGINADAARILCANAVDHDSNERGHLASERAQGRIRVAVEDGAGSGRIAQAATYARTKRTVVRRSRKGLQWRQDAPGPDTPVSASLTRIESPRDPRTVDVQNALSAMALPSGLGIDRSAENTSPVDGVLSGALQGATRGRARALGAIARGARVAYSAARLGVSHDMASAMAREAREATDTRQRGTMGATEDAQPSRSKGAKSRGQARARAYAGPPVDGSSIEALCSTVAATTALMRARGGRHERNRRTALRDAKAELSMLRGVAAQGNAKGRKRLRGPIRAVENRITSLQS